MNSKEALSIVQLVKEASVLEIAFVSLVILPIVLGSWSVLLESAFTPTPQTKHVILLIIAVLYVATIVVMKFAQSKTYEIHKRRDELLQYLRQTRTKTCKFASVRMNLGEWYSDERIHHLISEFPNQFRKARFQDGGVGLVQDTEEKDKQDN